ncbi:MAG: glutamate--tRNA ligase [Pseudomonadota bacterium]
MPCCRDSDAVLKTRFAPSPTGRMHLGNARTALFSALLARRENGHFVLRIEDTDAARSSVLHAEGVLEDLRWLGLTWDEGPFYQSWRQDLYAAHFDALRQQGLLYPCFCTPDALAEQRRAQLAAGRPPRYDGRCAQLALDEAERRLAAGEAAALRFRVPAGRTIAFEDLIRGPQRFDSGDIGDFVVRRTDGTPAFFFSNAVDDAGMGITHVLRGEDHLSNTPRQLLLLEALDLPAPRYGHLPLITGHDGAPLSKRNGSQSVAELRAAGYLPLALLNYLARLGHHLEAAGLLSPEALAAAFDLAAIGRAPARFDPAQLLHYQKLAVAALSVDAFLAFAGLDASRVPRALQGDFVRAVAPNVSFPAEAQAWADRLFTDQPVIGSDPPAALREAGPAFFALAARLFDVHGADAKAWTTALREQSGRSGKALFIPLRLALTGLEHGPELRDLLSLMPAPIVSGRLTAASRLAATDKPS